MFYPAPHPTPRKFHIDIDEWMQIGISIFAICLSLALVNAGLKLDPSEFLMLMAIFALTVGPGFILHELAHKFVAIKYGAQARYQAWTWGLGLMLAMAIIPQFLGIQLPIFLAPGAVMIYSYRRLTPKEDGLISLAGPATNMIIALAFIAMAAVLFASSQSIALTSLRSLPLWSIAIIGMQVNLGLAAFNLLPIFPLDGSKVISWDWKIWLLFFVVAVLGSGSMSAMLG